MKQSHYYAVVHKDEGSAFGIAFPDLPGCFSAADREEDILPNASEALALWFENGAAMIEPSPLKAIRATARDDLATGAFLLTVPRIDAAN